MTPSAAKVQCPFCLGHRRLKGDGTMYAHDYGRPGYKRTCRGAGLTIEQAKVAKSEGLSPVVTSGRPDRVAPASEETQPEDIF